MKKYQIGIIGYGDFTKVICEYLEPYADIVVSSRKHTSGDAGFGAIFGSLEEVLARPVIIPSIPSQFFEDFFVENKKLINPEALVVDVCSVKVKPLEVLKQNLPATCSIIGTHPLFGPASIKENRGVRGLKCAFCPVRSDQATTNKVKDLLSKVLELKVIELTPEEHDRQMAYAQGLSHYIARVMDIMNIPKLELSTLAYDDLYDMKMVQAKDSWELFESIMKDNPFARGVDAEFKKAQSKIDQSLKN